MQMNAVLNQRRYDENWEIIKEELRQKCNQIYYMSQALDNVEMMKKSMCFCEEKLGCHITK